MNNQNLAGVATKADLVQLQKHLHGFHSTNLHLQSKTDSVCRPNMQGDPLKLTKTYFFVLRIGRTNNIGHLCKFGY